MSAAPLTYRINDRDKSITCLVCGLTSYNRHDIDLKYCGNCREFHLVLGERAAQRKTSMKIVIEATDQLTHMDGVPVRVWKGRTENGNECFVFVHRIAVANSQDQSQFDRELQEQLPPGRVFNLWQVL